jgi:hypothetical protein
VRTGGWFRAAALQARAQRPSASQHKLNEHPPRARWEGGLVPAAHTPAVRVCAAGGADTGRGESGQGENETLCDALDRAALADSGLERSAAARRALSPAAPPA